MERLVGPMKERFDPYVVSWLKWKKTFFVQLKVYETDRKLNWS